MNVRALLTETPSEDVRRRSNSSTSTASSSPLLQRDRERERVVEQHRESRDNRDRDRETTSDHPRGVWGPSRSSGSGLPILEGHVLPAPHAGSGSHSAPTTLSGSIPPAKERFPPPSVLTSGSIVGRSPTLETQSRRERERDREAHTPPSAVTPSRSPIASSGPPSAIHPPHTRRPPPPPPSSSSISPSSSGNPTSLAQHPMRADMPQPIPPQRDREQRESGPPLPIRGGVLDLLPPQHEQSHQRHQKMQMQVQTMQVARQDVGDSGHAPGEVLPVVRRERVVLERGGVQPERESEREREKERQREKDRERERERERESRVVSREPREETPPQRHFQGQFHTQFVPGLSAQQQREMKEREREREMAREREVREREMIREREIVIRERERDRDRDRDRDRERERDREMPFGPPATYHHMHPSSHFTHGPPPPGPPQSSRPPSEPSLHPHSVHPHGTSHGHSAPSMMGSSSSSHDGRSQGGHGVPHPHHTHSHSHSHPHHHAHHHHVVHHHHRRERTPERGRDREKDADRDKEIVRGRRAVSRGREREAAFMSRERERVAPPPVQPPPGPLANDFTLRERERDAIFREREREREMALRERDKEMREREFVQNQRDLREREFMEAEMREREREFARERERRERDLRERETRERDREILLRERDRSLAAGGGPPLTPREIPRDREPLPYGMPPHPGHASLPRREHIREREAPPHPSHPSLPHRERERERERDRERENERDRDRDPPPHGSFPLSPRDPSLLHHPRDRERERERPPPGPPPLGHPGHPGGMIDENGIPFGYPSTGFVHPLGHGHIPPNHPHHHQMPISIGVGVPGVGLGASNMDESGNPRDLRVPREVPGYGLQLHPGTPSAPGPGLEGRIGGVSPVGMIGMNGVTRGITGQMDDDWGVGVEEEEREVKSKVHIDLGVYVWPKTPFPWIFGDRVGPAPGSLTVTTCSSVENRTEDASERAGESAVTATKPAGDAVGKGVEDTMDVDSKEREPGEVDEKGTSSPPSSAVEKPGEKMNVDDSENVGKDKEKEQEKDEKITTPELTSPPTINIDIEAKKSSPTLSKSPTAPGPSKPSTSISAPVESEPQDDSQLLDTQTLTTIVFPSGYLPSADQKGKVKMRIWGGGLPPSPLPLSFGYSYRNEPVRNDQLPPSLHHPSSSSQHPSDSSQTSRRKRPRRRRIYTDDSDPFLCALHSGWITWSAAHRAKEMGKDLKVTLRVIRCIGGGGEAKLNFEDSDDVSRGENSRLSSGGDGRTKEGVMGSSFTFGVGADGAGTGGWGKEEVVGRFIGGVGERFWCTKNAAATLVSNSSGRAMSVEKENKDTNTTTGDVKKESPVEEVGAEVEGSHGNKPKVPDKEIVTESNEEDDGRSLKSAGWGSGHDGSAIEVVDAEWVDKSAYRCSGRHNRSQRLLEYTLRRTSVMNSIPTHSSSPTNTYLNPRKRRRIDCVHSQRYPTYLWRPRKRQAMANAVPLAPVLEVDDEEEGEFERCLVSEHGGMVCGKEATTPTVIVGLGGGGVWYKYEPDVLRNAFESWPSREDDREGENRGRKRRRLSSSGASASEAKDKEMMMMMLQPASSSGGSTYVRREEATGRLGFFCMKTQGDLEKVKEYMFPESPRPAESMEVDQENKAETPADVTSVSLDSFDLHILRSEGLEFWEEGIRAKNLNSDGGLDIRVKRWKWV